MAKIIFISILMSLTLLSISCNSTATTVETQEEKQETVPDEQDSIIEPANQEPPIEETIEFTVTKELYDTTYQEIEGVISELNEIVRNQDFETWLNYLSDEYRKKMSDPENLLLLSESRQLKEQNIVLNNIKEYFLYVFIPSRAETWLDKIEFLDAEHVKVLITINNTPYVLYHLVRENEAWKIGIW